MFTMCNVGLLQRIWADKFRPTLSHRPVWHRSNAPKWEKALLAKDTRLNNRLHRDKPGFQMDPTTSEPEEMVRVFYYLPKDDHHPSLGKATDRFEILLA